MLEFLPLNRADNIL